MSSRNSVQIGTPVPASTSASSLSSVPLLGDAGANPRLMDGAAFDYFLIELVHTLRASSSVASARAAKIEQEMVEAGLIPPPAPVLPALASTKDKEREREKENQNHRESMASTVTGTGKSLQLGASTKVEEEGEEVRSRLENIGVHVGANITERLCRDKTLFSDTLDSVKFICKDIWAAFWDKQVDNLRTNHRGVYVLQDNSFKPIARLASHESKQDALRKAKLYVAMPAGIIRGALLRLGFASSVAVTPEITTLPSCTFQVKLPKNA